MSKVAHSEAKNDAGAAARADDKLTKVARETVQGGADETRETARLAEKLAGKAEKISNEAAEGQKERARRSAHDAAAFGQTVMAVLSEQARDNMAVATAFGRAADWEELVRTQKEFIDGSFGRMSRLGALYRELLQSGMASSPFASRR